MSKLDRDIRNMVQLLVRNNVSAIYPVEIAHLLHCPAKTVEDILFNMVEEELLKHSWELHCCQCGEVMSSFIAHQLLTSGSFPCSACYTQTEAITMNEIVSTFYPNNQARS